MSPGLVISALSLWRLETVSGNSAFLGLALVGFRGAIRLGASDRSFRTGHHRWLEAGADLLGGELAALGLCAKGFRSRFSLPRLRTHPG